MNTTFPTYFRFAKRAALKSSLEVKVGACLVIGKSVLEGFNKPKTHPKFANPDKHVRKSIHAELDCLLKTNMISVHGDIYVYREVDGKPAMARPCEHCMEFLKKSGIDEIYYSIPEEPFWKMEKL